MVETLLVVDPTRSNKKYKNPIQDFLDFAKQSQLRIFLKRFSDMHMKIAPVLEIYHKQEYIGCQNYPLGWLRWSTTLEFLFLKFLYQ